MSRWVNWLKLPQINDVQNLDAQSTTLLHAKIIQAKPFLRNLYLDLYDVIKKAIPTETSNNRVLVEVGSGGGFIKEVIPNVITSDIMQLPNLDLCFSVLRMPFDDHSVDACCMIDVLHHIPDTLAFFREMERCLVSGGKIIMIEPANTLWGRFIHQNFHHEPFDPSKGWGFASGGRLSCANGAIPWIVFYRDRARFEREFPSFKIQKLQPHTPFRYLVSGGVSMRQLLPSFTYKMIKGFEKSLSPLHRYLGMFLTVEIQKM